MRVIGIDPGTVSLGYGVVDEFDGQLSVVTYGVIKIPPKNPLEKKLYLLYNELLRIINLYKPEDIALEEPFVSENIRSALSIGRAQAAAMIAAGDSNLSVYRYSPTLIKQVVTNYGRSSKIQVNEMVKILLGLKSRVISEDATDALAVAICHINQCHLRNLISKTSK